jgi:hypothetical protein
MIGKTQVHLVSWDDGVVLNYPNNSIIMILFMVVMLGNLIFFRAICDIVRVISFGPLVVYITINEHQL